MNNIIKIESDKVRDFPEWVDQRRGWLDYPDKSLRVSSSESQYLYDICNHLGEGNYANLGTYRGASTAFIALGLRDFKVNGHVYTVDNYCMMPMPGYPEIMFSHFENLKIKDKISFCFGDTSEWGEKLKNKIFNFVFMDASHEYDGLNSDFKIWEKLVKPGGIVAFHDSFHQPVIDFTDDVNSRNNSWKLVRQINTIRVLQKNG